jgi:hypothetical protein
VNWDGRKEKRGGDNGERRRSEKVVIESESEKTKI